MKDRREQARTHYIHKISYTVQERIVGLFVFTAVGVLIWLLLSSGKSTITFEETVTIYGQIASAQGLSNETEIKISGLKAGKISSIDIKDNNTVVITMSIDTKFHPLLREDSKATLSNPGVAVLGGSVINISAGNKNKPILSSGSTIQITQAADIKETLNKITNAFEQVHSSIEKINAMLNSVNTNSLGNTLDNLDVITSDIRKISTQISSGKGTVGSILYDEDMNKDTKEIIKNLVKSSRKMEDSITKLNAAMADIPEIVEKMDPLINQVDKTVKATQRIWPLSSAIGEQKEKGVLTSPAPVND